MNETLLDSEIVIVLKQRLIYGQSHYVRIGKNNSLLCNMCNVTDSEGQIANLWRQMFLNMLNVFKHIYVLPMCSKDISLQGLLINISLFGV